MEKVMQVSFQESLEINGKSIHLPGLVHRAYQHTLSEDVLRRSFGEMILQTLANEAMKKEHRTYIANLLEDQLHTELQTRALLDPTRPVEDVYQGT